MADKKTTANYSLFHDLRRFGVEALCLLMLLYGAPLQALESVTEPISLDTAEENTTQDEPSWVEPVLETAGHTLDAAQDEVQQLATSLVQQPWTDAFGLLFTASHVGASSAGSSSSSAPPSPPKDEARPSKDYDLASLAAGFFDKNALDAVPLLPGWNQVSLPEIPTSSDPATALNAIGGSYHKVYAYNGCDAADPWKVYDPNDLAASDLTAIGVEQGLLINATAAVSLPSDGTLPDTTTIQLCTGWNLIGFPSAYPRHVKSALAPIRDKVVRVYAFDPFDLADNWKFYEASAPAWASDLDTLQPGMGYWVLVTEDVQLEIKNVGEAPTIAFTSPQDLDVITAPTEIQGTVASDLLDNWQLRYRGVGENDWVELATGYYPVQGKLGDFDPTLLLNGMYELELVATDLQGQQVTDSIAIVVEGNMKIGHFTLSFVDLAIPLSGLDIQVVRTYDSRQRHLQGDFAGNDFGPGWSLDIRQGSYRNNRPPGDGWRIPPTEGPWGLPCSTVQELKSHLTTVRLSDQEVYRFRLTVKDPGTIIGGCIGRAEFEFVDGPVPGATLEILGNDEVLYQNNSDELRDPNSFALFVPEDVKLTTRDGRIFLLDLADGVTHLEDLNGNTLEITPEGITHSSGRGIEFERDAEGRIERIIDPMGNANVYAHDEAGDHVSFTDRMEAVTTFAYADGHYLEDIVNALGVRAVRTEYDDEGRMVRVIDAAGKVVALDHDLDARREVITNRLGFVRVMEYDGRGNVVREVDELGNATLRTYDGRDNLLSETDPLGHTTRYTYSATNDLAISTDALGHVTTTTTNSLGQVETLTDPLGRVSRSTYDAAGNLQTSTDSLGQTTTHTVDAEGNLLTTTDPLGLVTTFTYDAWGRLLSVTNALGHTTHFSIDANGNRLSERHERTNHEGSTEILVTDFTYDALDRLIQTALADGTATSTTYDFLGRVASTTNSLGRSVQQAYDALGRPIATTYPDGTEKHQTYNAEGQILTRSDQAGRVTSFVHDDAGRPIATVHADGSTLRQAYDAAGRLIETMNARGFRTTYAYNAANRRTAVTDALGQTTAFTFDASGNVVSVTNPLGYTTTYSFDALDRRTRTTSPDGTKSETTYDTLGRRSSETDPEGRTTRFNYDPLGRITAVVDPLDQVTVYGYDEVGNQLTQTDASDRTTHFEVDALGRRTARILPTGERETKTYRADGTLATRTDFLGRVSTFERDVNGRLIRRAFADGQEHHFTYTPTGRRATAADSRGITTYTYDVRDRLVEKVEPSGNRLTYAYDAEGNPTVLTASIENYSFTTATTFDGLDRITILTDPEGRTVTQTYDANGNRTHIGHANGLITSYTFDSLDRLTLLETLDSEASVLQSYAYTLGPAGQRLRIDEIDGTIRSYAYDLLDRLTTDEVTAVDDSIAYRHSFTYDSVGNRLAQTSDEGSGAATTALTYDERDRLLSSGATTYRWNVNGQLTTREDDSVTWDADHRMTSVTLADSTIIAFAYDVDGNRIRSSITPPGGPTATVDHLIDTRGSLSHVVADVVDGQPQTLYVRSGDELVSLLRPVVGQARTFHSDGLGSIRLLSDNTGTVTDRYLYTAFGERLLHAGEDEQAYGFQGQPLVKGTGLAYHRSRWLEPATGRFVSEDRYFQRSLLSPLEQHQYLFAKANPINLGDPAGENSESLAGQLGNLSIQQSVAAISVVAIAAVECAASILSQGERHQLCSPEKGEDEHGKPIVLYRGLKKAKPSKIRWQDFRFDDSGKEGFPMDGTARGLSVYELPTPTHEAHLPFFGQYSGMKLPGTVATITSVGGLPIVATARYTPIPDGDPSVPIGFHPLHWDIDIPLPEQDAMKLLRALAKQYLGSQ